MAIEIVIVVVIVTVIVIVIVIVTYPEAFASDPIIGDACAEGISPMEIEPPTPTQNI